MFLVGAFCTKKCPTFLATRLFSSVYRHHTHDYLLQISVEIKTPVVQRQKELLIIHIIGEIGNFCTFRDVTNSYELIRTVLRQQAGNGQSRRYTKDLKSTNFLK